MLDFRYIIIIVLSFIIGILLFLLIFLKISNDRYKRNQEFDFNTKRFIIDSLNNLHTQYQELFSGMRMVINKIDENESYKKLSDLKAKITRLENKINNDYKEIIKDDFEKKENEKLKIKKENNEIVLGDDENV